MHAEKSYILKSQISTYTNSVIQDQINCFQIFSVILVYSTKIGSPVIEIKELSLLSQKAFLILLIKYSEYFMVTNEQN